MAWGMIGVIGIQLLNLRTTISPNMRWTRGILSSSTIVSGLENRQSNLDSLIRCPNYSNTHYRLSGFVNQISIQVSILGQLAAHIKAGQYTDTIGTPKKLVLVGHSFGSFTTQGLVASAPEIADAVILTGISFTLQGGVVIEGFDLRVAALQDKKWKELDNGYVIWDDVYANVNV
jgi:hypothetical protein